MQTERLLTISESADRIGVDYETLRRWIAKGAVSGVKTVGPTNLIRLPESVVEALIRERRTTHN